MAKYNMITHSVKYNVSRYRVLYNIVFYISALFFAHTQSYAGDAAQLYFIGFSEDGNYLAFEQYGISDGSGFAYSEIITVNVPDNSFAYPAVTHYAEEDMSLGSTRDHAMTSAQSKLDALAIIKGNTGQHVIHHPMSDLEVDPKYVRFYEWTVAIPGLSSFREYTLTLNEIEVSSGNDGHGYVYGLPKMLELILGTTSSDDVNVLQRDTKLPKRRNNVLSYRIQDVYVYHTAQEKYIAVFIDYSMPGFEGPDIRFMVVTGKIEL